ncbi:fibroblast growth factor receptor substrate 2-like [Bufo gargarizans]|uniref:fibroblast growth factor receptor substrate 2-like n=1 Tax=Bufo gargarizans TaxID=30331 RepID=UPI001CF5A520|nr:fibroblast growth factor receptor substrate 2-like [Bufo gargarizans]
MGLCLCSRAKHGDPEDGGNRFRVINVNDNGKNVCPGIMELTETSLIFHIKRGSFVKWPYISLMKYGYDSDLFSFVCGRRCQTGEGIFGFRCSRAEELFNLLQRCMQNNRISVISDTDGDTPVAGAERSLPYRYEAYPSFPAASSILSSSHRPEPIGSEYIPDPRSSECCTSADCKEVKRPHGSHLPLEQKVSDGGISQMYMNSYLDVEERRGFRLDQAYMVRNMIENEEIETFDSTHSGDINGLIWDTGYDSDDRLETSWVRRMGYENVSAVPGACVRSRSMLVSVSSSDSQSTSIIPADCVASQPSSPSIFEEQYDLEQNISTMNEGFGPLYASKRSSARDSMIRQDCVPLSFNFDLRQTCQGSKTLNYIQVEMESGCDSDNPQTPQSPDGSVQWSTCHQSEFYTELDLEKTTALSLIQRNRPKEDGTRKTRHNSKHFPV